MLRLLNIIDFVLIPQLKVEFHTGLNLLTGETGSGKSIIVDAVNLLLGARRGTEVIREGAQRAIIEGEFELGGENKILVSKILEAIGISPAEEEVELIIRREINAHGRHRVYVNDQNVTATTLKSLQPFLLEIHGQFEQQSLLSPNAQLEMLDRFGSCLSLKRAVEKHFISYKQVTKERQQLARDLSEREQQLDLLTFQLGEIERIRPEHSEDAHLLRERSLLVQAEKRAQLSAQAYSQLYESDTSILSFLAGVRRQVEELGTIDPSVQNVSANLEEAIVILQDAAETMRDYSERAEYAPERLQAIDERLAELERLKRKYNTDLASILDLSGEIRDRLALLDDMSGREEKLQREFALISQQYLNAATQLSKCRNSAIPHLEEQMKQELEQVAMDRAAFSVKMQTLEAPSDLSQFPEDCLSGRGLDQVEFFLSANQGESLRPLARVASGGELSRLMLAMRLVVPPDGGEEFEETLIFDEIDAGVGGLAAESVGRRLKRLATRQQVLCVTHQPQIARFADHHYHVAKRVISDRTVTEVKELNDDERIHELARMIGGKEEAATLEAARWLLDSAQPVEAAASESKRTKRKRALMPLRNQ